MSDDNGRILQELREIKSCLVVLTGVALELSNHIIPAERREKSDLDEAIDSARLLAAQWLRNLPHV
jgi:hypothetical protein